MLRLGILVFLLVLPLHLYAHSPLESSEPKNGATLNSTPEKIFLVFKSPAKLIKVSLSEKTSVQTDSFFGGLFNSKKNKESWVIADISKQFAEEFILKLPPLSYGEFSVEWRAMSEDGHIIKGNFSFIINEN